MFSPDDQVLAVPGNSGLELWDISAATPAKPGPLEIVSEAPADELRDLARCDAAGTCQLCPPPVPQPHLTG